MKLHYVKILVSTFFIYSIMSCNGKKEVKNEKINVMDKKNNVMRKLDKKKLEKYKMNNQFEYTENDTVFKLEDQGDRYKETKNKKREQLRIVNVYDKDKLVLIGEGNFMFDCPIGIHTDYDLEGNIVEEKNFDKGFSFSFEKLKKKLLVELNINVENTGDNLSINRGFDSSDKKHKYYVTLYSKDRTSYRYIIINGVTGAVINEYNERILEP